MFTRINSNCNLDYADWKILLRSVKIIESKNSEALIKDVPIK